MKKTLLAAIALAFVGTASAQTEQENLTSKASDGSDIFVKNSSGNCVLVKANKGYVNCGVNTPEPPPPVTPEQPRIQMVNETVTLDAATLFDFDKYNLRPKGKQVLDQLVQDLNQPGAHVQSLGIVGHTDSKGSDAYNQKLSERRANTVAQYLASAGVPQDIMQVSGEGERHPVASNKTAAGRQQNRRVEVTVQGYIERQQQVAPGGQPQAMPEQPQQ